MSTRATCVSLCVLLLASSPSAQAQADSPPPLQAAIGGGNLLGHRGLLRTSAALNQPAGTVGIHTSFEFFSASELLPGRTADTKLDHSRLVNAYSLLWAPFSFLEAALGLHVISDNSSGGGSEELQVTVGDPELSLKGGYEVASGLTVGGLLDARLLTGAGFFEASESALNFSFAALVSWFGGSGLPIGAHANIGFIVDGSENLFQNPSALSSAQLFAAQVSSFNRFSARIGVQYVTKYVGPFVELVMEPFVGSGAPGFGESPTRLSLGAQAWIGAQKSLQLLAALDLGLTGVGDGEPADLGDNYAFVIPRWNLALSIGYRFDPFYEPPSRVIERTTPGANKRDAPARAAITGKVLDSQTLKPVWNATVKIIDEEASSLAVDPRDGSFRSFDVPLGTRTIIASAEGYLDTRVLLDVLPGGANTVIQMTPKVRFRPGTLRGTVTGRGGRELSGATILIPELDRTLSLERDGTFRVSLKPGQYKVVVSSPGMRTQERAIRVVEGDTVILNVELYK